MENARSGNVASFQNQWKYFNHVIYCWKWMDRIILLESVRLCFDVWLVTAVIYFGLPGSYLWSLLRYMEHIHYWVRKNFRARRKTNLHLSEKEGKACWDYLWKSSRHVSIFYSILLVFKIQFYCHFISLFVISFLNFLYRLPQLCFLLEQVWLWCVYDQICWFL